MKIAIISDIHDNFAYLDKFIAWSQKNKIERIICCGDITTEETIKKLASDFLGRIDFVFGNIDMFTETEIANLKNVHGHGRIGYLEIDKVRLGFCHEPFLLEKVKEQGECDFIFYGHTHKPWIENREKIFIANPGTLGGVFQKSTFAVLDTETKNLELVLNN